MNRLELIKARHAEAGGGDGDLEWLIARLEEVDAAIEEATGMSEEIETEGRFKIITALGEARDEQMAEVEELESLFVLQQTRMPPAFLDEALNSGNGAYRP